MKRILQNSSPESQDTAATTKVSLPATPLCPWILQTGTPEPDTPDKLHWCYDNTHESRKDLHQGDIIIPTESLRDSIGEIHQWFNNSKYLGFLVLTQTCDLVRRKKQCNSEYVTIAAIRPLWSVWKKIVESKADHIGGDYYGDSQRDNLKQLFRRIVNQNESGMSLFYLHKEPQIQILQNCVALLRVSITLRSREHYSDILESRVGGLTAEFTAKLGWLCGNIYSRVGVQDWSESDKRQKEQENIENIFFNSTRSGFPKFIKANLGSSDFDFIRNSINLAKEYLPNEWVKHIIDEYNRKQKKPAEKMAEIASRVLDRHQKVQERSRERLLQIPEKQSLASTIPLVDNAKYKNMLIADPDFKSMAKAFDSPLRLDDQA